MARRKEKEEQEEPVTNLKGHPIHFDENTTENWMRRVSVRDMMELAKRPDSEGRLLLHEELERAKPNEDIIEVLLQVEPERIKKHVLMTLLEAWPDSIKQQCSYGFTPLHKALMANVIGKHPPNIDNITMIVEAYPEGAGIQNNRGQYPLYCCIENKLPISEIADTLIELGGKWMCDVSDKYGRTPLHIAVARPKNSEINTIVETLLEKAPQTAKREDHLGMLPLHWAVSRQEPVLEVLIELIETFPMGIFHKDHYGKMPIDRVLAYGNWRCGSTMNFLNQQYEGFLVKRKLVREMWEKDFLANAPHVSKLKAPKQVPRPTPYLFGTHDWCLKELTTTERQMALLVFKFRVTRKLHCTDHEMNIFLVLLRHEFVKRGGKVDCFGPPLAETSGGGPESGPKAKWWLAKIYLPDWDPNGNNKEKSYNKTGLKKAGKKVVLAHASVAAITNTLSDHSTGVVNETKEEGEDEDDDEAEETEAVNV